MARRCDCAVDGAGVLTMRSPTLHVAARSCETLSRKVAVLVLVPVAKAQRSTPMRSSKIQATKRDPVGHLFTTLLRSGRKTINFSRDIVLLIFTRSLEACKEHGLITTGFTLEPQMVIVPAGRPQGRFLPVTGSVFKPGSPTRYYGGVGEIKGDTIHFTQKSWQRDPQTLSAAMEHALRKAQGEDWLELSLPATLM